MLEASPCLDPLPSSSHFTCLTHHVLRLFKKKPKRKDPTTRQDGMLARPSMDGKFGPRALASTPWRGHGSAEMMPLGLSIECFEMNLVRGGGIELRLFFLLSRERAYAISSMQLNERYLIPLENPRGCGF